MRPRLLPIFFCILLPGLCASSWGQSSVEHVRRSRLQHQAMALAFGRDGGRDIQLAQGVEDIPTPDGVPDPPTLADPPVSAAPENGFPITTLPDNFGSTIGMVDDSTDSQVVDEVLEQVAVESDGVEVEAESALEPIANGQIRIDSPMNLNMDSVVDEAFAGPDFDMVPEPIAVADNGCDCELCRLKRAGYSVVSVETTPEPDTRRQYVKCVSPGSCPICDADKFMPECAANPPGNCLIGGWLAWGGYANSHGIKGRNGNVPLGFNNIANQVQLHQAWIYAERPLVEEEVAWGYRIDFMFGTDGPDTQAFGDDSWDGSWDTSSEYGFAMPQLYFQASWAGWRAKIGRFYTIIGYEVVQAPDNFFYSHAYTMYYNEPFTHTGFLFDRNITDDWKIYAGWTAGWDSGFANRFGGSTFLGGVSYTPNDNFAMTYTVSAGDSGVDLPGSNSVYMQSLILDFAFGNGWNYIFQTDYQYRESDSALSPGVFDSHQYGINQYLIKKINCRWSAGARMETFYAGTGNGPPLNPPIATPGSHFNALTFGLNYRPSNSMLVKPEVRYDWVDSDGPPGGPFANGTKRSQFALGVQSVWSW